MNTEQLKGLWRETFGDEDSFIDTFFEKAYAPERCRIRKEGDTLAAMLFWFDCEFRGQKIAYLYAVATKEDFRGRGLCAGLMADTHAHLASQGYAAAMLFPADEGLRKMYGKMGYADCGTGEEFSCQAGEAVEIREVSAEEYGLLRRKFLPEKGVIQEGENLNFLGSLAKLYAGENFLLAADVEGETLQGIELLGDREAAPGIAAALGCKEGRFTAGASAMIRPLGEMAEIPGYLGLVFD